ncbi:MAG: DUF917 domain-containing protein [Clostridia bacterium]|nr:DUF917 domain-containing protein [Clostridia bacterium]
MAKSILKEVDLKNVIIGATVIGAGGGGSPTGGLELLELYKRNNPGKPVELELIAPEDMQSGAYAAVTAGMGAPRALIGKDFTPYAVNSYEALVEMAAGMGRELKYACPVEIGGFNTFVPMLIALLKGIPIVDADGAGRAVPALDTLLLHVNGLNTSPLAMADHKNNRLTIELADPRDASTAEVIGRNICMAFDMIAGLSGWMVTKDEILSAIATGTITYAKSIGEAMAKYDGNGNIYDFIARNSTLPCKAVCTGRITKMETKTANGFDYGVAVVSGEDGCEYKIPFQNENLAIYRDGVTLMTAPDIISLYNKDTMLPMTNADTEEGQYVDVGIARVDEKWWKQGEGRINEIWKPYFSNVEYTGKIVRFK